MEETRLDYIDKLMKKEYEKAYKQNYFSEKRLEIVSIKNGIILPVLPTNQYNTSKGAGGVLDENGNYVESSAQLAYNMKNRVYGAYKIDKNKLDFIDDNVVYINYFYKHWGHFIIDITSRLWFLIQNENINKYKIVFTSLLFEDDLRIDGNYKEFLELLGINYENILIINKPTKFRNVIIPECSIYPGKYYTKEYIETFDKVRKNVCDGNNIPEKIYLSRAKFKVAKTKEVGEQKIEKIFNDNGYVSIYPELLSLSEQIKYINGCKELACISGTLPHNIIFANKNKKIIIINKTYKINKHQELINQAKNAKVVYVDSHISLFPIAYGKGPFILTVNKNFKKFAKDNKLTIKRINGFDFNKINKKIWYLIKYVKKYKFKIYDDGNIDWKQLFRYYIFK